MISSIARLSAASLAAVLIAVTVGIPALPFVPAARAAPTVVDFANAPSTGLLTGVVPGISNAINWGPPGSIDWEIQGPAGARYLIPRTASSFNPLGTFTGAGYSLIEARISNPNPSVGAPVGIRCGSILYSFIIPPATTQPYTMPWASANPPPRCSNFEITNDAPIRVRTLTYDFLTPPTVTPGRYKVNFSAARAPEGQAILTGIYPAEINLLDFGQDKMGTNFWAVFGSSDPARPGLNSLSMANPDRTIQILTAKTVLSHIDVYNTDPNNDIHLDIYCGGVATPEPVTVPPLGDRQAELSFGGATACTSIRIVTDDEFSTEIDGLEFEVDVPPDPVLPFGNATVAPNNFQVEAGPVRVKLGFPYTAEWFGPYTKFNIWIDNLTDLGSQSQAGEVHVALYRADPDDPNDGPPGFIRVNCAINVPAATAGQWYSCTFGAAVTMDPWDRYFLGVWHPQQNNFRPLFRHAGSGSGYEQAWDGADSTFVFQWGSASQTSLRGASFYMSGGATQPPAPTPYDTYVTGTANSSLVAYYPMYETSGTAMPDTSGNNKHGTYSNSVVLGGLNGATFDGNLSIASTPNLNLSVGNVVTVAFWAKDNETRPAQRIMFESSANYNVNVGSFIFNHWDHGVSPDKFYEAGQLQASNKYNTVDFATAQSNAWHHYILAFARDQPRGCLSISFRYDGVAQTRYPNQCWEMNGIAFPSDKPMYFGARLGNQFPWMGVLRGMGIWTRSLTSAEINAMVAAQFN